MALKEEVAEFARNEHVFIAADGEERVGRLSFAAVSALESIGSALNRYIDTLEGQLESNQEAIRALVAAINDLTD